MIERQPKAPPLGAGFVTYEGWLIGCGGQGLPSDHHCIHAAAVEVSAG